MGSVSHSTRYRRFQKRALQTTGERELLATPTARAVEVCCSAPVGSRSNEECSDSPTFVIPRRGMFVLETSQQRVVAEPNTVLLFERQPRHIFHPIDGGDECFAVRVLDVELAEFILHCAENRRYWVVDAQSQHALHLASYRLRDAHDALEAEEIVSSIIAVAGQLPPLKAERHAAVVDSVRERIACDPFSHVGLHDLAHTTELSTFELARHFRARTRSSIHQYRMTIRLANALSRLQDGEENITALALDLGFASHAHFTTAFRRRFGMPPSRARRRHLA